MTGADRGEWRPLADAHAARVDAFVEPHLARRAVRVKHPVHDFLFTYYSQRPAQLRRWHPGYGVALADAPEYAGLKGLRRDGDRHAREYVDSQAPLLRGGSADLLRATEPAARALGCFGLHEWAMVYRQSPDEIRHNDWPLRLGSAGTDEVVESHQVKCSHFDAFRFFTPSRARPQHVLQPGRDDRPAYEQPGCLHAGMDLYKHAFRLTPMISSATSSPTASSWRATSACSTCALRRTTSPISASSRSRSRRRRARRPTSGAAGFAERGRARCGEADRGVRAPAPRD